MYFICFYGKLIFTEYRILYLNSGRTGILILGGGLMMKQETLDEIIERMVQDCKAEYSHRSTETGGTEQFSEMVEKYTRKTFDSDTEER